MRERHALSPKTCSKCGREISKGELYYVTGRDRSNECYRNRRNFKRALGLRLYCADCYDFMVIDVPDVVA